MMIGTPRSYTPCTTHASKRVWPSHSTGHQLLPTKRARRSCTYRQVHGWPHTIAPAPHNQSWHTRKVNRFLFLTSEHDTLPPSALHSLLFPIILTVLRLSLTLALRQANPYWGRAVLNACIDISAQLVSPADLARSGLDKFLLSVSAKKNWV